MREKHFVLDIEAVNTRKKIDDVLQIAFVEANYKNGFWQPGKEFDKILHSSCDPETQFAKEHMVALYKKCNQTAPQTANEVRKEILAYLKDCGARPPYVYLMGLNATMMDIPFLEEQGYMIPFYRETIGGIDVPTGDFHYRVYEQSGSISLAQCVLGIDNRNELMEMAFQAYPEIEMPAGRTWHDALFDCYYQLRTENGLLRLIRNKLTGNGKDLYELIDALWTHWQQPCIECDYGDGGHCLTDEKIKLQVTQLLKIMRGHV